MVTSGCGGSESEPQICATSSGGRRRSGGFRAPLVVVVAVVALLGRLGDGDVPNPRPTASRAARRLSSTYRATNCSICFVSSSGLFGVLNASADARGRVSNPGLDGYPQPAAT